MELQIDSILPKRVDPEQIFEYVVIMKANNSEDPEIAPTIQAEFRVFIPKRPARNTWSGGHVPYSLDELEAMARHRIETFTKSWMQSSNEDVA